MVEYAKLIESNPGVMSGALVIVGTRVPVRTLLDHLEVDQLEEFLIDFPSVRREHAEALRDLAQAGVNLLENPAGRVHSKTIEGVSDRSRGSNGSGDGPERSC